MPGLARLESVDGRTDADHDEVRRAQAGALLADQEKAGAQRVQELTVRRKRLLFQSRHRGVKELDLVLGAFAEGHLERLASAELDLYEAFLAEADADIFAWLSERAELPADLINPVTRALLDFARKGPPGS